MDLNVLGKRIKDARKRQALTLESASERLGISRNFLWEIEAGRKVPALGTLYNLAVTLNVSLDYLMGITDTVKELSPASMSEHNKQINQILALLDGYGEQELALVRKILADIKEYTDAK